MSNRTVCLSFDFDAISLWIARGLTTPTAISRGEFGAIAAERLLDLLKKYNIKGTWFIPGHTIETYPEICSRIHAEGHEIGHHGYIHEPPTTLTRNDEERILVKGSEAIRHITGEFAKGYRSPSWDLSSSSIELLLSYGFKYDSSMMGNDYTPYWARKGDVVSKDGPVQFGEQTSLVEMPISWSLDDFTHFEYVRLPNSLQEGLKSAKDVLENWISDFRYMTELTDDGVVTYTFHPQVIGRGHRIRALEHLIQSLKVMGATFSTMEVAADNFARKLGSS